MSVGAPPDTLIVKQELPFWLLSLASPTSLEGKARALASIRRTGYMKGSGLCILQKEEIRHLYDFLFFCDCTKTLVGCNSARLGFGKIPAFGCV